MNFVKREVLTEKLTVTIKFELNDSIYEKQECIDKLQRELENSHSKAVAEFIIALLRATASSTWEFKSLDVD